MNINDIIKKPLITEKSANSLPANIYTFEVDKRATKTDVKRAIETIFSASNAKVGKVNIQNYPKKAKRVGRYSGFTPGYKKAIVTLSEGSIPIYGSDGVENNEEKPKKKARQIIDTEKIMEEAGKK